MIKERINQFLSKLPIKINPYVLAVALLVLVIIISLSGRRSFDDTYDRYTEAMLAGDAEAVVDLLHDSYISNLVEKGEIEGKRDLIKKLQAQLDWYNGQVESGKYVAELQSVHDQDMDAKNLPFDLTIPYGDSIGKIKEAKKVCIYYTNYYTWDGRSYSDTILSELIYFVKIGNSWYLGQIARY